MDNGIFTIGHSTHAIGRFIKLLENHRITAICDVRSRPYSRMNPQFNREPLKQALAAADIKYVFLGRELGARSEDKHCYKDGRVQYSLLAQTALFKQGLERVLAGAQEYRVALMCAEKEPLECHRTILVSRHLSKIGATIRHILADGSAEEHDQTSQRLVSKFRMEAGDLFRPYSEIVDEAYTRQSEAIAYQESTGSDQVTDSRKLRA